MLAKKAPALTFGCLSLFVAELVSSQKKHDGAHEPACKHVRKATYVQMTLL